MPQKIRGRLTAENALRVSQTVDLSRIPLLGDTNRLTTPDTTGSPGPSAPTPVSAAPLALSVTTVAATGPDETGSTAVGPAAPQQPEDRSLRPAVAVVDTTAGASMSSETATPNPAWQPLPKSAADDIPLPPPPDDEDSDPDGGRSQRRPCAPVDEQPGPVVPALPTWVVVAQPVPDAGPSWPQLLPLDSACVLPPCSVQSMLLGDVVATVSRRLGVSTELAMVLALGALASVVGGKLVTAVSDDWSVLNTLYSAVAAPPSARKTPAYLMLNEPLLKAQQRLLEQSESTMDRYAKQVAMDAATKQYQAIMRASTQAGASPDMGEAAKLLQQIAELQDAQRPALIYGDMTAEALTRAMHAEGGRVAIASDEGGVLETLIGGRYSQGRANLDAVLTGYDGAYLRVDRATSPSITIPSARLSINVATQPGMLRHLMKNEAALSRGVWARCLVVDLPGRAVPSGPTDSSAMDDWHRRLVALLAIPNGSAGGLQSVPLSPAASARVLDLSDQYRTLADRQSERVGGWLAKQAARVVRLASLLHSFEHAGRPVQEWPPIPVTTIENLLVLEPFWFAHASRVLDEVPELPAQAALNWIMRNGQSVFAQRELHADVRRKPGLILAADVEAALTHLTACNFVRPIPTAYAGQGRPTSPRFQVNPTLLA